MTVAFSKLQPAGREPWLDRIFASWPVRQAADALANADAGWLDSLITRRVPLERFAEAFTAQPEDVKVIITIDGSS